MFKLYLPHFEDQECTTKDHLQNQGNWYSKHGNYLHYSYTSLTAPQLDATSGSKQGAQQQKLIQKTQFSEKKKNLK